MNILKETTIIIAIYFLGEILSKTIISFIPGNILGMLILLLLLITKVIKLEAIANISKFFLENLAFFFIPAGVGLMASIGLIKGSIIKILLICIISTIIVMGATALTIDFIIKVKERKGGKYSEGNN